MTNRQQIGQTGMPEGWLSPGPKTQNHRSKGCSPPSEPERLSTNRGLSPGIQKQTMNCKAGIEHIPALENKTNSQFTFYLYWPQTPCKLMVTTHKEGGSTNMFPQIQ